MAFGTDIQTYFQGRWHEGNAPILGAADHGAWQGTMVFDGARAFEGVTPDLDRHCARLVASAEVMGLDLIVSGDEILQIALDGVAKYAPGTPLYIRPMMWSCDAMPNLISPDPASTAFALCVEDIPLAAPEGMSLTVSPYLRPDPRAALTESKCAALYANNGRILREANRRGFDNALSLDPYGFVAETASTNIFMVRDGVAFTPVPNGTFLNGITRQRVRTLLCADGVEVEETSLKVEDFRDASEIFTTGNANKVIPVTRFEDRQLQIGPVFRRARELYWDFSHSRQVAAE